MFIGRELELNALERLYQSNKFEFAVIYGRRRVGKTALINKFIDDKNAIYFMGVESNAKQNLENFSKNIIEFANGINAEFSFLSFQAALEYVLDCIKKNTTKIRNIKAYMLTCIYSAPQTISSYYTAEVNHDLYGCS